ncbi:hypothetical protein [Nocardia sp. NBC_01329]|uniref:hypothetical protein n=1 Tax=Nocardia sp. NBC_01329 TaxID=2903594 RepID=UPI002E14FD93|nr:hypothetical protein OG405_24680 [Nocardia sp. NBC_01329]
MSKGYLLGALMMVSGVFRAATAEADPEAAVDHGDGCVIDPAAPAVTIDSLRWNCTGLQHARIYRTAQAGSVPSGVMNGWVTSTSPIEPLVPAFWIGKAFDTGPDGGQLTNRITGADLEGWPANVYPAPSRVDGEKTWVLDYTPAITPQVYDEIREIVPGVWLGYSWWRSTRQTPVLLSFVLAHGEAVGP